MVEIAGFTDDDGNGTVDDSVAMDAAIDAAVPAR